MVSIKDPARTRILTGPDNFRKTFSHTDTPGRVKQKARDTETEERKEKQRRRLPIGSDRYVVTETVNSFQLVMV